ncbi:hypothetical protein EI94DRAFT_1708444 [Lactarius quietus]|nr:hypothetical protein EI94DRAFT_1708444 [Lactarius quietus]
MNKGGQDGKLVGAATAVMPSAWSREQGTQNHDQAFELGKGVSQYDINTFGISLAGQAISSYLNSMIQGISNLNLRVIQEHALNFVHVTHTIFTFGHLQMPNFGGSAKQNSEPNRNVPNSQMTTSRWFKKNFEPLNIICECSYEECTLAHIIFDCPLFSRAHEDTQIDNCHVWPSMWDLFASLDSARQLYKFLDHTMPAHKPLVPPWLPGDPRLDPAMDRWYWDDSIM